MSKKKWWSFLIVFLTFVSLHIVVHGNPDEEWPDLEETKPVPEENWESEYPDGEHINSPATKTTGFKICFVGDIGTGKADQYRVAKAIANERCDQVRVVGDLVYEFGIFSSIDPQLRSKFFKPYKPVFKQGIPLFLVLGNHDYFGKPDAFITMAKNKDQVVMPSRYFSELHGDVCFFGLDTTPFDKERETALNQWDWFKEERDRVKDDCAFSILWAHHPYRSAGKHGHATGMMKEFYDQEVIGKLDLIVAGHDHNLSDEGEWGGTRMLVSGSGAKLREVSGEVADGNWAASDLGFVSMVLNQEEEGIVAHYKFILVHPIKHSKWKFWKWFKSYYRTEVAWEGSIEGRGIR